MPFIDAKITKKLSDTQKENLKAQFGQMVSILGKPERFLMVGFEDGYDLYMGGEKLASGAYVSVSLFGNAGRDACEKMTGEICKLFEKELGIPGQSIYVTYHGVKDWGWNGANF